MIILFLAMKQGTVFFLLSCYLSIPFSLKKKKVQEENNAGKYPSLSSIYVQYIGTYWSTVYHQGFNKVFIRLGSKNDIVATALKK